MLDGVQGRRPAVAGGDGGVASSKDPSGCALQNYDGGFAFWRRGDESWPYLTVHVAHALARAKAEGLRVARRTRSSASKPLPARTSSRYSLVATDSTARARAAALRALRAHAARRPRRREGAATHRRGGRRRQAAAWRRRGWICSVLAGDDGLAGRARRRSAASLAQPRHETAGAAHFVTALRRRRSTCCSHSIAASTRILLEALIRRPAEARPDPEGRRGAARATGPQAAGENTQENAFVLLGARPLLPRRTRR